MFHQQSSINVDPNLAYLRNKELEVHFKKINEIKSRKNKFLKEKTSWTSQSKKRIMNFDLNQVFNINRDNKALYNKLVEISSREKNRAASHSTGKNMNMQNQVKNNLHNKRKKRNDDDANNMTPLDSNLYMNHPLLLTNDYLGNENETDDAENEEMYAANYNSVGKDGGMILPSIYMKNPSNFTAISPDDFEPFERLARNTKGFVAKN